MSAIGRMPPDQVHSGTLTFHCKVENDCVEKHIPKLSLFLQNGYRPTERDLGAQEPKRKTRIYFRPRSDRSH